MTLLTPEQKIREILGNTLWECDDDDYRKTIQQLLALKSKWEAAARIDELKTAQRTLYEKQHTELFIVWLAERFNQLTTNGDKR